MESIVETSVNMIARTMEIVVLAGAFLMAIGAGLRRVYKMARNIETLMEQVDRNGKEALAASERLQIAADEITSVRHKVQEIKKEVLPNGGASLRDAVNRIESRVAVLETWHQAEGLRPRTDN
jgi:chromosome segregation ATPase